MKPIDDKLIGLMKRKYMQASKPNLKEMAKEYEISYSKVTKLAAEWKKEKTAKDLGKVEGAKVALTTKKVDGREAIEIAIATLTAEVTAVEAKSMEGVANALGSLLKTQRELYQPSLTEFCRWMIDAGYDIPSLKEELIRQTRWSEKQNTPDAKQA